MATSIVTIDAPDKVVTCDAEGSTQHVFNVKNTSGHALTVGAKVIVKAPTQENWLKVEAPAEQELGDNVLTQIPVRIQVPADGAPGRYDYRLLVYSVRKSGEEFTESEAVAFEVPKRESLVDLGGGYCRRADYWRFTRLAALGGFKARAGGRGYGAQS